VAARSALIAFGGSRGRISRSVYSQGILVRFFQALVCL
jgi:hypothetical protein